VLDEELEAELERARMKLRVTQLREKVARMQVNDLLDDIKVIRRRMYLRELERRNG